jgi:hypothetical protein
VAPRDLLHRGVQVQLHAGRRALAQQQFENVTGLVVAEQLPEFFLVVRHAVLGHQLDEIPLGVAGQGRLAEVAVLREEVARLGVHIGEVAAAAAGHEDFLAGLVGVVDQQHAAAAHGGREGAHQARGPGANDDDIGCAHDVSPYRMRTRKLRPLILPLLKRDSACLAIPRSTAT